MKIAIGSDHGGYFLKQAIIGYLKKQNHNVLDVGCFSNRPCDYPEFGYKVAKLVSDKTISCGILICKSGIGYSIVANKLKGVRAALCYNVALARSSRQHNDSNVLVLGALYTKEDMAKRIVSIWLRTKKLSGRHLRRVRQIEEIEKKEFR